MHLWPKAQVAQMLCYVLFVTNFNLWIQNVYKKFSFTSSLIEIVPQWRAPAFECVTMWTSSWTSNCLTHVVCACSEGRAMLSLCSSGPISAQIYVTAWGWRCVAVSGSSRTSGFVSAATPSTGVTWLKDPPPTERVTKTLSRTLESLSLVCQPGWQLMPRTPN